MKSLLFWGILIGLHYMCSGEQCDLIIQKDGNILDDGEYAVGLNGQINQIYCKALCSGQGLTPALKWYKIPSRKPIRMFRGRVYQVKSMFGRVNILTIRNMLHSDIGTYKCRGWLKGKGWLEKTIELTYACKGLAHLCDTSECISQDKLCDGYIDCMDGTDEQNCECEAYQFQCDDGSCISSSFRCDGVNDCSTAEDEKNCSCFIDSFTCDLTQCVDLSSVCNGVTDCLNAADEENCTEISTLSSETTTKKKTDMEVTTETAAEDTGVYTYSTDYEYGPLYTDHN